MPSQQSGISFSLVPNQDFLQQRQSTNHHLRPVNARHVESLAKHVMREQLLNGLELELQLLVVNDAMRQLELETLQARLKADPEASTFDFDDNAPGPMTLTERGRLLVGITYEFPSNCPYFFWLIIKSCFLFGNLEFRAKFILNADGPMSLT